MQLSVFLNVFPIPPAAIGYILVRNEKKQLLLKLAETLVSSFNASRKQSGKNCTQLNLTKHTCLLVVTSSLTPQRAVSTVCVFRTPPHGVACHILTNVPTSSLFSLSAELHYFSPILCVFCFRFFINMSSDRLHFICRAKNVTGLSLIEHE